MRWQHLPPTRPQPVKLHLRLHPVSPLPRPLLTARLTRAPVTTCPSKEKTLQEKASRWKLDSSGLVLYPREIVPIVTIVAIDNIVTIILVGDDEALAVVVLEGEHAHAVESHDNLGSAFLADVCQFHIAVKGDATVVAQVV